MPVKFPITAFVITLAGALLFIPFLGAVNLFDWDEINFAESAREMLVTGNFTTVQINYQSFWEKPPLFFWLQAASMSVFGINEFAARFPNAVAGILTMLVFYTIGTKRVNRRFGLIWVLCMAGSFLPHLYFKSGIIDPVFNLFIFLGMYYGILLVASYKATNTGTYAMRSAVCIGLATLTKGPVALLIFLLCAATYWIINRFRPMCKVKDLLLFALIYIATAGIWFAIDLWENGMGFIGQFIQYQLELLTQPVAGHGGAWYYHFVVVFIGCFPMSVIALPALTGRSRGKDDLNMHLWMLILFWVVMILFSLVTTKIVHYSSLSYFPLSYLAAKVLEDASQHRARIARWLLVLIMLIGGIFSLLLVAAPWLAQHKELLIPYLSDPFAVDCLNTDVSWSGYEVSIGFVYLVCVILAVSLLWRKRNNQGTALLFGATALCMFVYLKVVVPKIEAYSQGPAIRFYESLQGKKAYVVPMGFKSYAHYFYFRKPPGDPEQSNSEEWLLTGKIDRPAYFVLKTTSMSRMEAYHDISLIRKEGGFAFYVRQPGL